MVDVDSYGWEPENETWWERWADVLFMSAISTLGTIALIALATMEGILPSP